MTLVEHDYSLLMLEVGTFHYCIILIQLIIAIANIVLQQILRYMTNSPYLAHFACFTWLSVVLFNSATLEYSKEIRSCLHKRMLYAHIQLSVGYWLTG